MKDMLVGAAAASGAALIAAGLIGLDWRAATLAVAASGGGALLAAGLRSRDGGSTGRSTSKSQNRANAASREIDLRVLGSVAEPCIVADERGVVIYANTAATTEFPGLDPGINLRQWFRSSPILDALRQAAMSGSAEAGHVERRPAEKAFRVQIARIAAQDGLYLCLFTNQTEALRVDRMRADFIANASHELRTPLTAVMGFLETIDGPARNDPANRDRFVKLMIGQTQRMARLIDDLLSLSRLESQSSPARMEGVDLALLAASCADGLSGLAKADGVTIDNNTRRGALMVKGDPEELTQVIQNLLENAIKYGSSGKRIVLDPAHSARGETGLAVRDFGPGIPAEHIPRLTERFYRVDVEASRQQKGTGLGLAIVKHILTRHRARLVIESSLGKGTAFTVLFPTEKTGES
jgi:two-component system, OmpR family, phosphate regulon sensor histidine kinase PhoR